MVIILERIEKKDLYGLFKKVADTMADKKDELCSMDAFLGDGDLGLTMEKGFGGLPAYIEDITRTDEDISQNIGKIISKCGMKLSGIIPSTMGFLMGSALLNAGKCITNPDFIDAQEYVKLLDGCAKGIVSRGKCQVGERTVLDSVYKAFELADAKISENPSISLETLSKYAYEGALKGLEATKDMSPKYGKAAVHKDKALGIEDQGAKAGMYLIKAMYEFISGN